MYSNSVFLDWFVIQAIWAVQTIETTSRKPEAYVEYELERAD